MDVATDVSQRPDPAGQSFYRNVVWADRHPGTGGKALPLPDLTLQEPPCSFLGCELGEPSRGSCLLKCGLNSYSCFIRV